VQGRGVADFVVAKGVDHAILSVTARARP